MKKRYTDEQITGFLKQAVEGAPIKELCRKHGFSDASFACGIAGLAAWMCLTQSAGANWKRRTPN